MSQPPTPPPGSPGQPLPQPQPQPWPQQGMQPPADRASTPTGRRPTPRRRQPTVLRRPWTPPVGRAGRRRRGGPKPMPPPWTTRRPLWRRMPARLLIAGAFVLVVAVAGLYFNASRSATGEIDKSGDLSVVDLRVGDCFDDKDLFADQIGDVKAVPCTTEHEFEVFYVGAMGDGSYPTGDALRTDHRVRDVCGPELRPRVPCLYRQGVRRFRPRHLHI